MNTLLRLIQTQFSRQVGLTFITQIVRVGVILIHAAIIARWLGPEGKGILLLAFLAPNMLSMFLSGGLGLANVYFAGSQKIDVPRLTANSVAFTIISSVLGFLVLGVLILTGWLHRLMPGVPIWIVLLATLSLPLITLSNFLISILQGMRRIKEVSLVSIVQGLGLISASVLLVAVLKGGLIGAVIATWISSGIALAMPIYFLQRNGGRFASSWDMSALLPTLGYGLRGHIGTVFQFFNYRLDAFIVNIFLGPPGYGIYSTAVQMAELLWQLPNAVGFVIFPKASASHAQEMNRFTPRILFVTLGITLGGALFLALSGRFLINLIFGSAFATAHLPLLALLPGAILMGGGKVLANDIAGRGHLHYNSISAGLSLALTVILDLALIPRFGEVGAGVASSVAYAVYFLSAVIFYRLVSRQVKK